MRTTNLKSMLAIGAFCLMGSALQAQTQRANARIPFAFEVSSTVLPEGDYSFQQTPSKPIAEIMNRRTGKRCYVLAGNGSAEGRARTSVVFHRYGNTYFLSEIWSGGESGSKIPVSKHEKNLMRSRETAAMEVVSISVRAD